MIGQSAAEGLMHLLLTARLGDGTIQDQANGQKSSVKFMGTNESWIRAKASLLRLSDKVRCTQQSPKAWGTKQIFHVQTPFSAEMTALRELSVTEILSQLDEEDLIIWYLDDGSYHKTKHFMNLYSNKLSESESQLLIQKFEGFYGIAPKLRADRKKDGRSFPYLYLGTELVKRFSPKVEAFIRAYSLNSLLYKIGKDQGSTTIPEGSRTQESSKQVTGSNQKI